MNTLYLSRSNIDHFQGHSKPPTNQSDYPRSGDELRQVEGGDDQFEVEENVDLVKHEQERKTLEFKVDVLRREAIVRYNS